MKPEILARFAPLGIAILTVIAVGGLAARPGAAAAIAAAPVKEYSAPVSPIASFFMPTVRAWEADIARWAEEYGLDPNLAATVMQIESCGDPRAVSPSGAQGLFQVMPYHFEAGEDMRNPETNARRGLAYLTRSLLLAQGDVRLALAGYNGGHGVISWDEADWPEETRNYAYWGGGIYADAAAGGSVSPRLEEWLAAGGTSLCDAALSRRRWDNS
ncbi:MAG: transglycosylase SLT domain-containing protein [Anaerolineales bacterium]|nr:transglycosylase SLT domain-containing protein [Anaerolineales bacterium]